MFEIFAAASFLSIWYWVLHVVVWTLACYRTLGVPHDMLLRARRLPEIAERVDLLARLAAARIGGIYDRARRAARGRGRASCSRWLFGARASSAGSRWRRRPSC